MFLPMRILQLFKEVLGTSLWFHRKTSVISRQPGSFLSARVFSY